MVSVSIMFGSFSHYKRWVDTQFASSPPIANLALAACLTGATEAVLTPLERIQMLLQDRKYHRDYKNTVDALVKLRKFGSAEYYRGLTCVLMRNGPSNALFFGLREEIKKLMPYWGNMSNANNDIKREELKSYSLSSELSTCDTDHLDGDHEQRNSIAKFTTLSSGYHPPHNNLRPRDSMLHNFLSGAILGMFISTLFYPLSVVRTRMQTRAPGTEFLSMFKAFNQVYSERDRKFSRLFHGCLINVLRQFVSWGIINCSYEYVLDILHNLK